MNSAVNAEALQLAERRAAQVPMLASGRPFGVSVFESPASAFIETACD